SYLLCFLCSLLFLFFSLGVFARANYQLLTTSSCYVILRLVADQLLCVFDVPAHAGVGRHAVDHRETDGGIGLKALGHELAEVPIGQPHQPKPRAALRGNVLSPIDAGLYPTDANGDDGKPVDVGGAFTQALAEQLPATVRRAIALFAVHDIARPRLGRKIGG